MLINIHLSNMNFVNINERQPRAGGLRQREEAVEQLAADLHHGWDAPLHGAGGPRGALALILKQGICAITQTWI